MGTANHALTRTPKRSTHWDSENILAHARCKDIDKDTKGKRSMRTLSRWPSRAEARSLFSEGVGGGADMSRASLRTLVLDSSDSTSTCSLASLTCHQHMFSAHSFTYTHTHIQTHSIYISERRALSSCTHNGLLYLSSTHAFSLHFHTQVHTHTNTQCLYIGASRSLILYTHNI